MTGAVDYEYRYPFESRVERGAGATVVKLATDAGRQESPWFARGVLRTPRLFADLLLGVGFVARTRFYTPPGMLAAILARADPVVTSGGDRIRFESFSACCGVYARLDLLPEALDPEHVAPGTTNVDLGAAMRAALAQVTDDERVVLSVGTSQVEIERTGETVIERKVALPLRWLKGFVEVQATQAGMRPALEVDGAEAHRFLRALPRQKTGAQGAWVEASGRGLRLAFRKSAGAVPLAGLERVRLLEDLSRRAARLRLLTDGAASAWEMTFPGARFVLVVSPEPSRGFSGEGRVLNALTEDTDRALPRVRAALNWQPLLDARELAASLSLPPQEVKSALATLGTLGLVGFDLAEGAYFHRTLPFDFAKVEELHPRLVAARKLVAEGAVRIGEDRQQADVASGDIVHRVRFVDGAALCTCPWFAKHRGERGPCKHVLAASLVRDGDDAS